MISDSASKLNAFQSELSAVLTPQGAKWGTVCVGNVTYAVFALPYVQLAEPHDGFAFIDSYFVVSNKAYFLKKQLASSLEGAGFAVCDCTLPYKHLAVAAGLGVQLRSTLVAFGEFGTRVAMEIVGVEGCFSDVTASTESLIEHPPVSEKCRDCGICEALCPEGCINEDGFSAEKCLRSQQNDGLYRSEQSARAAGANVWGCDICQRHCPFNRELPTLEPQGDYRELLRLENIFHACAQGKKGCEPYRDLLGGNYLRPSRLMALTLNAMSNTQAPQKYLPLAEQALSHPDERVREAARRFSERLK